MSDMKRREFIMLLGGAAAAWLDLRRCACCRLLLMGFELASLQPQGGRARGLCAAAE